METRQITTVRGVGGPFHARLTGVGASLFKPMAEQAGQSGGFALTGWIRPAAGCALPAEVARIEDKRGDACTIEAGADGLALVVPDGVPHLVTDGDAGGWMWCALLADERGAAADAALVPFYYGDNHVSLRPGETVDITIEAPSRGAAGANLRGWKVVRQSLRLAHRENGNA